MLVTSLPLDALIPDDLEPLITSTPLLSATSVELLNALHRPPHGTATVTTTVYTNKQLTNR